MADTESLTFWTGIRDNTPQMFSDVKRRLASAGIHSPDELSTFLCLVCYENRVKDQRLMLEGCSVESHNCCLDCVASFFQSRILDGRVFELICPVGAADGGCNNSEPAVASVEEVERCLAQHPDVLEKYHRFRRTKIDASLRECPDCQNLCKPELGGNGTPLPEVVCSACSSIFCYYHSAAHRGSSCDQYEAKLNAETKKISEKFGTKDCPQCMRQTMKTGGCNHMTCQVCRCNWCWICASPLTVRGPFHENPVYWHYSDDNTESGCQQFAGPGEHPDMDEVRRYRCRRLPHPYLRRLTSPVWFISVLILALCVFLTLFLWIVFYISMFFMMSAVCFSIRCSSRLKGKHPPDSWDWKHFITKSTLYAAVIIGTIVFLIPFTCFTLAWGLVSIVMWFFLWAACHVPGLWRILPTTTALHLRFFVLVPLNAIHQCGNITLACLNQEG